MEVTLYSSAIFVTNLERAVEFYRDVLGLPLRTQGGFGADFPTGEGRLAIHEAVHPDSKALVGRHTGLTFRVDGILHFCGDLHAKGVTFIAEPTKQDFGIMAMIADPDGNMMALWGGPLETE
jgi:predicted enzyme related to lactoylglutathione lyase